MGISTPASLVAAFSLHVFYTLTVQDKVSLTFDLARNDQKQHVERRIGFRRKKCLYRCDRAVVSQ